MNFINVHMAYISEIGKQATKNIHKISYKIKYR